MGHMGFDTHYNMLYTTTTNFGYTYVWTFLCPLCILPDNKICKVTLEVYILKSVKAIILAKNLPTQTFKPGKDY